MTTLNTMAREFNGLYGIDANEYFDINFAFDSEMLALEELMESLDELCEWYDICMTKNPGERGKVIVKHYELKLSPCIEAYAKECGDKIYIVMQRMTQAGMNVDRIMECLHESNMSKALNDNDDLVGELLAAELAHPDMIVKLQPLGKGMYVMKDEKSKKVIKPMKYQLAVIPETLYTR